MLKTAFALLFLMSTTALAQFPQTDWIVSTTGTNLGHGTLADPWDLQTALGSPALIRPGDRVLMRGGTYAYTLAAPPGINRGLFTSRLVGTAAAPIKVMPYPGEVAKINGAIPQFTAKAWTILRIDGAFTQFWDLEITNWDPNGRDLKTRVPCVPPFVPPFSCGESNRGDRRGLAIDVYGPGTKLINNVIHDTGQGIGLWAQATDAEAYGNVIFNNGWDASNDNNGLPSLSGGRLAGHGLYTQNKSGTKGIHDNIIFNNFGDGFHCDGSGVSTCSGYDISGNIHFNDRFIVTGPSLADITLLQNMTWGNAMEVGNSKTGNTGIRVINNYLANLGGIGLDAKYISDGTVQGNTIAANILQSFYVPAGFNAANWILSKNAYFKGGPKPFTLRPWLKPALNLDFAAWTKATLESGSTNFPGLPKDTVFVRPNAYDPARFNIAVYNWSQAPTVDVVLPLNTGDAYELRSVQDYYGDVVQGTYDGKAVKVAMTGRSLALPIGYPKAMGANTFPRFGVFVVVKR